MSSWVDCSCRISSPESLTFSEVGGVSMSEVLVVCSRFSSETEDESKWKRLSSCDFPFPIGSPL